MIGLSNFLAAWWWALLLGWSRSASSSPAGRCKDEGVRMQFDRMLLRLPLIGRLIRDLHAARMARTLSTMVASRLPLLEGLKLTTGTVHNRVLRAASADIAEAIRTGGSLSGALKRAGIFPPLLVYLAAAGEASGKLDVMLERAADYLEREFDTFTTTALSLLEPAIIIVMGAIVALIVLSILLPILQLDTLAGGYDDAILNVLPARSGTRSVARGSSAAPPLRRSRLRRGDEERLHPGRADGRHRHHRPARHDRHHQRPAGGRPGGGDQGAGRHRHARAGRSRCTGSTTCAIRPARRGCRRWSPASYIRRLPNDPWNHPYRYAAPGRDGRPFTIATWGADGREGGIGRECRHRQLIPTPPTCSASPAATALAADRRRRRRRARRADEVLAAAGARTALAVPGDRGRDPLARAGRAT